MTGKHFWHVLTSTSVMQSTLLPQSSWDQLLPLGMRKPSSRLRHPGSETPNRDNTLSAFNVFNQGISYCDWKQNVPDSYHVGVASRQKLARLIWLVRVKIAWYCSHLTWRYRHNAFVLFISQESCSNSFSGSYCFGERDLKLGSDIPRSLGLEAELFIYT